MTPKLQQIIDRLREPADGYQKYARKTDLADAIEALAEMSGAPINSWRVEFDAGGFILVNARSADEAIELAAPNYPKDFVRAELAKEVMPNAGTDTKRRDRD